MKWIGLVAILLLMVMPLAGGGGASVKQSMTTLGQELQDLDDAYKKGLLTEKEYKKAKEDLIDKHTD
jgi:hypothetical protein